LPSRAGVDRSDRRRADAWRRQPLGKRERDRLLLALSAYSDLRRSEPLGLDYDVDPSGG
jgi:hypothetical protein